MTDHKANKTMTPEDILLDIAAAHLGKTNQEIIEMAMQEYANQQNERLKTELAEVKRFLQEMYHSGNQIVPELWRMRMERFVK